MIGSPGELAVNNLTLRDWFAGQALVGMTQHWFTQGLNGEAVVEDAYRLADWMLVEREKK